MAYLVQELIVRSYYLSGTVSQDFEDVSPSDIQTGLNLLNDHLSLTSVDKDRILYYSKYEFDTIQGQEKYFIPNLVQLETLTYDYTGVRWAPTAYSRAKYFGMMRPNNVNSLPAIQHMELVLGGADIYLYYLPQQAFTFTLYGKFSFPEVILTTDLSEVVSRSYIIYLRYALAELICHSKNIQFRDQAKEKLEELSRMVVDISPMDLSLRKISGLTSAFGPNWGIVNLSHGMFPVMSSR